MDRGYTPGRKVRAVLADGRINEKIKDALSDMGIRVIKTIRHPLLYDAISYHPDTVICPVGKGRMVVAPAVFEYYRKALECYRVQLIKGHTMLSGNYPFNIAYNIATMGNKAILYSRYTDPVVLNELKNNKILLIEVKQGYAKCSTAVVNENALITSDKGIANEAARSGMDVMFIRPGHIELEGLDYGFIGGCCGKISRDTIAFAGDISFHPDANQIINFCKKHHVNIVKLCNGSLIDIGSIVPIVEIN